ncbi:VapC toxin family PIN domain ribonuclease [Acuticoccus sediminis]|uniref:Ribonuclease VapC n=2 Tax=Acuticoccus sediminis TaxID=2184697 RepID=A0A8B2NJ88_9HYPH|nr:type II toxin-antitoxin system VapC family toxin [Acuticoccus sediminis]RAH95404.1 VapC toxin family PIN domain ribonuclease [Acuticoccus sediminis]
MTLAWLLDTNVLSDLIRRPQGIVAQRLAEVGEKRVATSIIVAAELRYGAAKKGSDRLTRQVEVILAALPVLALEAPVDATYASIRAELEHCGTPIGGNDLLIAAHTMALNLTLVTANVGEFARVPGLRVENWL